MKTTTMYIVGWTTNTQDCAFLMQSYNEDGTPSPSNKWGHFETPDLEVAKRVFANELEYVNSRGEFPKLSSFDWGAHIGEYDEAFNHLIFLEISALHLDEDGEVEDVETVDNSEYYYNE